MNQNQIQQLTSHLSQALDQNYDVVNMDAVLSVICALEGTTITKEQLEATRLAKYINQLRRRTKNEHLARRAKSLLKKWREMVGIQQNVPESHQLSTVNVSITPMQQLSSVNASLPMQQQPSSDFLKTDPDMAIHLPLSPSQQILLQDTQHSSDAVHSQMHHTSFSNLVNNVQKESKNILRRHEATPIMVEQTVANNENEAAVVIDIASDSDENDHNSFVSSKRGNLQNPTIVSASLAIPIPIPSPSPKQKKLKKKKHKDKDGQNIRGVNSKVADALSQADSEIFSLSNSSMSSIFSGDASTTLGNSQHNKQRLNASELTFTGRFRSVSSQNNNSAGFLTVRSTESSRKQSGKYDDYNIYDSSGASCSRLSPLNIEDGSRKMETKQVDARMQNLPAVLVGSNDMENTTSQSRSHLPKKRGRKRGSKGVDSLIAKESSTSLSQQIFFGQGSTVKKVKTTKELFNEIQSRKLSVSTTSNLSNSSTTNRAEQATMHAAILPRPASSCSDTSIHSPQILETYSANVTLMGVDTFSNKLDAANTDSDTVTSEPSRDSNKSQDIKGTSLDNSNSNSFGIFAKRNMNKKKENLNDVTTQLMHLIHSLKSPLSVYEIEEMYLSEMVPCSCLIVEKEVDDELKGEPSNLVSDNNVRSDPKLNLNNDTIDYKMDKKDILLPIERLDNDNEIVENQAKPVRSIFDLDFDDYNDDINSITYEIIKPTVKMEERKHNLDARNVAKNVDQLHNNYSQKLETENNETISPNFPMNPTFTVLEDPDCIAKQRFYVQTNKVTNFHINALHNYYIPNINGNWDDGVDTSSTLLSVKNNLIHSLESSYTVTNGADVVPKYGFITSDRIKKDLSSFKFLKPFKAKPFKSLIAPFLGVAKYLPTCRRAKRRLNITSNRLSMQVPEKIIDMGSNYNVATEMPPLKVNIDVTDSSHNENPVPINILHKTSTDDSSCSSVQSNNLLKLVTDDELQLGAEETMVKKKLVHNYWNGKNLNIKTFNNSSSSDSDSEDKTENANENDYENNEEYAIVQRPTSTSHDHIVLTIKKTPSKINSPANSMITTKTSPIVTLNSEINNVKKKVVPGNTVLNPLTKCQLMSLPFRPRHHHRYHRTSRRKRNISLTTQKVDLELKHIFNLKETVASDIALHEKLFFQHELCGENALGIKERIINYSSSSSNYDDESEIEVTSLKGGEGKVEVEAKNQSTSFDNTRSYNLQIETDTREDKFDSDDSLLLSSSDEDIDGDDAFNEPFFDEANNDNENNNLLKSFNSIYTDSQTNDHLNGSTNKYCNNNHLAFTNLTRNSIEASAETSSIKKLPLIGVEYRTGYRSSPEVNGTTTSIAGYQEFKEWHQVLQLKSYNNEPLIVLPYVVLE